MNKIMLVASAAALVVMTATAFAHDGATGVVKERMDAMSNMGKAMKSMSIMVRGQKPLDLSLFKASAQTIVANSGKALTELFPDNSNVHPSRAGDGIWSDRKSFSALANQLNNYATGMEMAAENSLIDGDSSSSPFEKRLATMPLDKAFNLIAKTCSDCHGKFRLKK